VPTLPWSCRRRWRHEPVPSLHCLPGGRPAFGPSPHICSVRLLTKHRPESVAGEAKAAENPAISSGDIQGSRPRGRPPITGHARHGAARQSQRGCLEGR
jgi:hypothetical protein